MTTGVHVLSNRAETEKIALLLGIDDPRRLRFLRQLPSEELRNFRERSVAALHDGAPEMVDRLAAASKLVPSTVAAAIAERTLGPRLAAAVAGRLEPGRAAGIVAKLPVPFTASACGHLDPRRIRGVLDGLDEDVVVRVGIELAERGDAITMGRFVGHLTDGALRRIVDDTEEAVILRCGFYADSPERLDTVLELLSAERLEKIVRTAADGLWPEVLAVAGMVGPGQRERIALLTARQEEPVLDGLVRATHEGELWEALLPVVALLPPEDRRAVATLPALQEADVLGAVVSAVAVTGLWRDFLPLVTVLPNGSRQLLADAVGELSEKHLEGMAREVERQALWEVAIPLIELMEGSAKGRIFALPAFQERPGPAGAARSAQSAQPAVSPSHRGRALPSGTGGPGRERR